jgi:hypothetical protein
MLGEWILCIALYVALIFAFVFAMTPVVMVGKYTAWLSRRFTRWQPQTQALALVQWLGIVVPPLAIVATCFAAYLTLWGDYKLLSLYATTLVLAVSWCVGLVRGFELRKEKGR